MRQERESRACRPDGPNRLPAAISKAGMATISILILVLLATTAQAQTAFIRVNQIGYVATANKRAYLMASASETGATFNVKNSSGTTVYSAPIGLNLGAWSGSYPNVYALDFSSVSTAGTYTIAVSTPIAATSPSFRIDTAANLYSTPLANTLYFYENERDGPNFIPTALRTAAGHGNDASAKVYLTPSMNKNGRFSGDLTPTGAVIDASGGWWDAGDYLKFVQTHSYTVSLLLIGVRDFPNQMGAGSATSNFTNEAKFGLDWLQKMWDDNSKTFYYQVGIGNGNSQTISDHDIWRLPQADDTFGGCTSLYRYICHRPVFINTAGGAGALISPNLAGRLAADFAQCYQVFKTSNPTYASQCLLSAEHVFDLANTAPASLLTVSPNSFYPETEWRDDLELGATESLFRASTGEPAGRPGPHRPHVLPDSGGKLGARLHHGAQRRDRHAEPLRRERAGTLRAPPGDRAGWKPQRPRGIASRAVGRSSETIEQGNHAGGDGSLWIRVSLERLRHDFAWSRAGCHGQ
ncbi:MAG TPA: glycoside hydrolase family 9 protein [Terriglobales bacterium]|nr:glycoside hydrolase family 9 protein [Terriglobales bacterium]